VLGLDPDPARLWPQAHEAAAEAGSAAQRAAAAVAAQCELLIEAAGPACVAVKPQVAWFERLGSPGWAALERTVDRARAAGLLVLADAKRGDVPHVATAYGQALAGSTPSPFGEVAGLGADAVTANPLMGAEVLEAILDAAPGAGLFVLVRTSNPGSADVEDLELRDGRPLWERLAEMVDRLGVPRTGASGLSDVGAVAGATFPEHLARMRELMPRAVLLLPGIGAQGGRVEDVGPAFAPGRAGGLVTASRSIAHAHEASGAPPPEAAAEEAERLRQAAWELA
jgi:orotidine-5'-phosphate decarboxylase